MKIRCVVFASFSRAQDAFPFQSGVLKIKQQGQIQPCDIEIPEHLSYVRVSEARPITETKPLMDANGRQ